VRLGSSLRIVTELLLRYEEHGLVTLCSGEGEPAYQLARPAESISVGEVLSAVRGRRLERPAAREGEAGVEPTVRQVDAVLRDAEEALSPVRQRTLSNLLDGLPHQPA
jgi:DNA-binding IscR family transcriptional regulator